MDGEPGLKGVGMNGLIFGNQGGFGPLNYFSGTMGVSGVWLIGSLGYTHMPNFGGNTLTPLFFNGITVSAAGNSLCGIVFPPTSPASAYKIKATFSNIMGISSIAAFRLTDGTTPFAYQGYCQVPSAPCLNSSCEGVYAFSSGNTATIELQGLASPNSAQIGGGASLVFLSFPSVQWEVIQIK